MRDDTESDRFAGKSSPTMRSGIVNAQMLLRL